MGGNQSSPGDDPKSEIFLRIQSRLALVDPKEAKDLGGIFLFNVMRGQNVKAWTMDLNAVRVYEGEPPEDEEPDAVFTLTEETLTALALGKVAARHAVQAGKCSVTGDIMRAMKLEPYIKL